MSAHDCDNCTSCGYCVTSAPHLDDCSRDLDAGGTAPTPGPTPDGTPRCEGVHLPERGAYLIIDGQVYAVHDNGAYVQIKASWRQRWAVTTDVEPINA